MSLIIFILILVSLIVVHELGHFGVAKLFGIKVEEFGVGFPPRIVAKKIGETFYSLNWLFFGGFVRILGENPEEGGSDPRSFHNKPKLVQAAVMVAGIAMNFIFAWLVLSLGYMVGLQTSVDHTGFGQVANPQTTIVAVLPNSPAQKAGLEEGDVVVGVETGTTALAQPANADATQQFMQAHADQSFIITVKRAGSQKEFVAQGASGLVEGRKVIGIQMDDVGILRLSPPLALAEGAILSWDMTASTAVGLAQFFSQLVRGAADFGSVAGPIGIADIGAQAVKDGFAAAVSLTALISINLALINILPVPGLDGGRLLILAIEAVIRRPVPQRLSFGLTVAGFALLIALMLVVSYHDVVRLVG